VPLAEKYPWLIILIFTILTYNAHFYQCKINLILVYYFLTYFLSFPSAKKDKYIEKENFLEVSDF